MAAAIKLDEAAVEWARRVALAQVGGVLELAVVNGAALEKIDETSDNASVLVAVRVTVTDIDGVNKPSQAYRLRIVVNEDGNGRMTGYDLKYPDGGN